LIRVKLIKEKKTENLESGIDALSVLNWTKVGDVLQSQSNGFTSYASLPKYTNEDKFTMTTKIKAINAGDFEVGFGKQSHTSGTVITLEKTDTNSYLKFWKMGSVSAPIESVSERQTLPIGLENNKEYLVSYTKNINDIEIEIIYPTGDVYNHTTSTLESYSWGFPSIYSITGQAEVSDFSLSMPYARNRDPKLLIVGDSFIEGNSSPTHKELRYSQLIANEIGEKECVILGRGGESTSSVLLRIYHQIDWFEDAKYCLLALCTNDTSLSVYTARIGTVISLLRTKNIIPILVTCTYRSDTNNATFQSQVNAWIRGSGHRYIDMVLAVTNPGDETSWKTGYLLSDGVHPSVAGHAAMFSRVKYDAPYLFQ
jgi:lysophospholipase L1-like esterase